MNIEKKQVKILVYASIIIILILLLIFISQSSKNSTNNKTIKNNVAKTQGIYREFSKEVVKPGEIFEMKLSVVILNASYYLIEEKISSEFEVIENDTPIKEANTIKIAKIMNAVSHDYSYKIKAPQKIGEYSFNGQYIIEGKKELENIGGSSTIKVQ